MATNPMLRAATSYDDESSKSLKLVWAVDGSNAPAVLEPSADPERVAFYRGYMCATSEQTQRVIEFFPETISLKPAFAEAHYNLGISYFKNKQRHKAIAAYQAAVKANLWGRATGKSISLTVDVAGACATTSCGNWSKRGD
jgi:tetratricopeptide (TPR) repeat protein